MNKFLATLAIAAATLLGALSISNSASATPSDAIPCAAGTYSSTGYASVTESVTCLLTPPGTYQDQANATSPIACQAGTFASASGSTACLPSPAGKYAPVGSVVPLPCPVGSFSDANAATCTPASAGHFVATTSSSSENPCAPGTYQPLSGQSLCLPAPAGSFVANAASAAAAPCPLGAYQPNTGSLSCLPAPLGAYVDGTGAIQVTNCPIQFTTATVGSTSAADCNISTVVTILVSPSPSPSPTTTPAPTSTQIPVDLRVQNVSGLKIPKTVKAGAKFSFGKVIPVGLAVKATASGNCKLSSSATKYSVTATKKTGTCKISLVNAGNGTFMPLNTQLSVKVVR